jgi:N-acetylmuramoyl-L-alanine amidase
MMTGVNAKTQGRRRIQPLRLCAFALIFVCVALGDVPLRAQTLPLAGITIVVDPGHGGADFGVDPVNSGLIEKTVVLDLAERLQAELRAAGATVATTRSDDRFVSLQARVRYNNALLFRPDNRHDHGRLVSLHVNSNRRQPDLRRVEVLVDPEADLPFDFAADLAARLRAATGGSVGYRDAGYPDGVHPADVAPVRFTYPRGHNVLTESAFLSNAAQAAQLKNDAFREAIVAAHLAALIEELGR